ncbi:MAG: class I SAM-dependent methyltransferase [Oscillospiraceae bacterium]|nr:class I SAM-dependent methyltransferase [Oscillospiraceae bacterium]
MNGHPGGEAHTLHMLKKAGLSAGASILDMGAGAGETLTLLRERGFVCRGIDREPRNEDVEKGDFLHLPYPAKSFDAVISQCAFFVSGDAPGALWEARRVLKPGGKLLLSDVFFAPPGPLLEAAGFAVTYAEDMTAQWRAYYLEALWKEEAPCCTLPGKKSSYWLLIGERRDHGSV